MCGANEMRNESSSFIPIAFVGYVTALVFFLLRMASLTPGIGRQPGMGRAMGLDDIFIIITVILTFPPTYFAIPRQSTFSCRPCDPSQLPDALLTLGQSSATDWVGIYGRCSRNRWRASCWYVHENILVSFVALSFVPVYLDTLS